MLMSENKNKEYIERAIDAITTQIELLSTKCKLEENRKNPNFDKILEASSLMLQLSRSLNELIVTKRFLEENNSHIDVLSSILNGRRS